MSPQLNLPALNGAPTQYDRLTRSLGQNAILVDARTFCELLSFAPQFGKLVNFFGIDDKVDGDWSQFFLMDPTIILASIESFDLEAVEKRLFQLFTQIDRTQPIEDLIKLILECCEEILRLAAVLDGWLVAAQSSLTSRSARIISRHIEAALERSIREQMQSVVSISRGITNVAQDANSFESTVRNLSTTWGFVEGGTKPFTPVRQIEREIIDDIIDVLEAISEVLLLVFAELKEFAVTYLPETLLESDHRPQIALFIAFVRLFQIEQATLNTVTDRFSEFYYKDVLKESPAGPVPDSVYVLLTLDPALGLGASAEVPAGTLFSGGKEPDGSPILYAADRATYVSAAAIAAIRSTRLDWGSLNSETPSLAGSSSASSDYLQTVLGTQISVDAMNQEALGKGPATGLVPWTTFGDTYEGTTDISETNLATLGFMISSNYLMLTGGDRKLELTFHLKPTDVLSPWGSPWVSPWGSPIGDVSPVSPWPVDSLDEVFEEVITSSLSIWLTSSAGWFQPDSFSCVASLTSDTPYFSLHISLPPTAPAVVGYNPLPKAPPPTPPQPPDDINPTPDIPTLKTYLDQSPVTVKYSNSYREVFPLSMLAPLEFFDVEIWTKTVGLTDFAVTTSSGSVDPTKPYAPFGGIPVVDAYAQFSNEELFVKEPESGSLSIQLDWYGLPQNDTGFTGYYKGYVIDINGQKSTAPLFDNDSFLCDIQVANPGSWTIQQKALTSPPGFSPPLDGDEFLFRTTNDCSNPRPVSNAALCSETEFLFMNLVSQPLPQFYDPSTSSIQVTLTAPAYAFGNILYAPNVMNAAIEDLPKHWLPSTTQEGCQPLADGADAMNNLAHPPPGSPAPTKREMMSAVDREQQVLLQHAHSFLKKYFDAYGPALSEWVDRTFSVPGSPSPVYQAKVTIGRLQDALTAIATQDVSLPEPTFPPDAADLLRIALSELRCVISLQNALDFAAPIPDSQYVAALQGQLSVCVQKMRQAYADGMIAKKKVTYPNPPWMPTIQGFSVTYSASCALSASNERQSCGTYYNLLPYGGYDTLPVTDSPVPVLSLPSESSLELGFTGLSSAQQLTLLVQMSAYGGVEQGTVQWQYLNWDQWITLNPLDVLLDTTNGLQNSGEVTFNLQSAVPDDATAYQDGYRWIRAVTTSPAAFPSTIGIYPHVLTATWDSNAGGSGQHLSQPLPPYAISTSVQPLTAIKTISNPMASFGGIPAQTQPIFQIALSERLRHKDRAILPWDYEQLVLESFPNIWQVQALSASNSAGAIDPGDVLVVVVAGPNTPDLNDPTVPVTTSDVLQQIEAMLAVRASVFATIRAVNPQYIRITVIAEVLFASTEDPGVCINLLNSDLIAYLSPWFYDVARAETQGRYVSQEDILQFIQSRSFVEYVVSAQFSYDPPIDTFEWCFLTSAAAHVITAANP